MPKIVAIQENLDPPRIRIMLRECKNGQNSFLLYINNWHKTIVNKAPPVRTFLSILGYVSAYPGLHCLNVLQGGVFENFRF